MCHMALLELKGLTASHRLTDYSQGIQILGYFQICLIITGTKDNNYSHQQLLSGIPVPLVFFQTKRDQLSEELLPATAEEGGLTH